jgi:hypothetical protein
MRKSSQLITEAREGTENEDFSENRGIPDREFLRWLNNAQDRLVGLIQREFPDVFQEETVISTVNNQEEYSLPADTFLGTRVDMVEYSASARPEDYYYIKKASKRERLSGFTADPSFYIRRNDKILLQPTPDSAGLIRLTYQKRLPKLDLSRGTIDDSWDSSAELDTSTNTFVNNRIIVDGNVDFDQEAVLAENQITIVDKFGVQKMRRIPVESITDISVGTDIMYQIDITPGFTFEDGETIDIGDTVLRGKNSTTHSELSENCERYLVVYAEWKALIRDSSTDVAEKSQELLAIETDIVESYRVPDADVPTIAILDDQFLSADGES